VSKNILLTYFIDDYQSRIAQLSFLSMVAYFSHIHLSSNYTCLFTVILKDKNVIVMHLMCNITDG